MRRTTIFALVASGVFGAIGSGVLAATFDWPARLDDDASTALPAFAAAEGPIRFGFALMLVASLALVPVILDLGRLLGPAARVWTSFGVAGAFAQTLGWVRWPIVVPQLARHYLAAPAGSPGRDAIGSSYNLINAYAGGALGEHLGWLFMGIWAIGLGLLGGRIMPKWLAASGLVLTALWWPLLLIAGYQARHVGLAAQLGSLGYVVWLLWLVAAGIAAYRLALADSLSTHD